MAVITLNTGNLLLEFEDQNGSLVGMTALATGWRVHKRAELGLSWRLVVPVNDELRNNPVNGEKQALSSCEQIEDGFRFVWKGVQSERAGKLDIDVTMTVKNEDGQAVWYIEVENRSPFCVESVQAPCIGDFYRPEGAKWVRAMMPEYASVTTANLWPHFTSNCGQWGVDNPSFYWENGAPKTAFVLLQTDTQGLYVGVKSTDKEYVTWCWEHKPGWSSSIDSRVSDCDDIAGKPVHTAFTPVHLPYIMPGEKRALMPVAMQAYAGDWHAGVDIYRAWRNTWFKPAKVPEWAKEPHSWLQIHINSPEDELRLRFTELPKVAAQCAKHGIKAIQLVGWNYGGQDQNNPCHDPDPRLGTYGELKEAIRECQAMGVKIILFSKFTWGDIATEWYKNELHNYAIHDPNGSIYPNGGYRYFTPTQLLDVNTKKFAPMCFGSGKYVEICKGEFKKLVDLGCAGMLYDECQHHGQARLCFDMTHGHRYGWPVYAHDNKLIDDLMSVPGTPEDFMVAGEACYDWEQEKYALVYHRSENKRHIPMPRYINPQGLFMTAVTGFEDRNMINQCLMCRYVISYEPYNFKGVPEDYPVTLEYGKKMDALRVQYRKFFWDGEFRDTCGAKVLTADGSAHAPYARFEAKDGESALVICNYEDAEIRVTAQTDAGKLSSYRLVDDETIRSAEGAIVIPPRSAAIVF